MDITDARASYCRAQFVDTRNAPPQIALALTKAKAAWVPREGAYDETRGPRKPNLEKLSSHAPLDSGKSKKTPDYPGIDKATADKLAASRKALEANRKKLAKTNHKLSIVTGVHAARRRKQAWHP